MTCREAFALQLLIGIAALVTIDTAANVIESLCDLHDKLFAYLFSQLYFMVTRLFSCSSAP